MMGEDELSEALGGVLAERSEPLTIDLLFRRHHTDVVRVVRRLLGPTASHADVEDVAQQTFIAADRALSSFRGESKPSTWLHRIAVRAVLMHLRSWKRRRRAIGAYIEAWQTTHAPEPDPGARAEQRQELERVWACLERIAPKKRMVFVLFEVEGLSGTEIAEALEVNEATVWTRLYHARKELVEAMRRRERR